MRPYKYRNVRKSRSFPCCSIHVMETFKRNAIKIYNFILLYSVFTKTTEKSRDQIHSKLGKIYASSRRISGLKKYVVLSEKIGSGSCQTPASSIEASHIRKI